MLLEKWVEAERDKRENTPMPVKISAVKKGPAAIKTFELQFAKLKNDLAKLEKGFKAERKKIGHKK